MNCQNQAPLVAALNNYLRQDYLPFHMPGHKGGQGTSAAWQKLIGRQALHMDLTEVEGLDDLHNPRGPIRDAEALAAALMGGEEAKFLINGVTVGITAAILARCQRGDKIIIPRHAHRSIFCAVALAGAIPVYLQPQFHRPTGFPLGVDAAETIRVLQENRDAKALVMVHPTYHGCASDLMAIAKNANQLGISVIADEAHGAHFKFSAEFPPTAMASGAAVAVQGWHKTMGSLTQSAMLLTREKGSAVGDYLMMLQSTSPSFLLMASLDAARQNWAAQGAAMADIMVASAIDFRREIGQLKGISCLDREAIEGTAAITLDPTKIVINGGKIGLNGYQLAQILRHKYQIEAEMAEFGGVTMMLTIGDTPENNQLLLRALADLDHGRAAEKTLAEIPWTDHPIPVMAMTPGDALQRKRKSVAAASAHGLIAGEYICPYPPGVPLVVPGEIITREIIQATRKIINGGGRIQGLKDQSLQMVQVIEG